MHLIKLFIFIFASKPSSVFLQSHPQNTLYTSFQAKWRIHLSRLRFAQEIHLFRFGISVSSRFRFEIWKNKYWNKNHHPRDQHTLCVCMCVCMCASFQAKQTALTFSAQICPKMDLGLDIGKTNVKIIIGILEILYMPIIRQTK